MKVGDTVKIISGSKKGTEAKIVEVDLKNRKAMLDGVNIIERHMRKSYLNPQGGKKNVHVGIDMSNLKVVKALETAKKDVKKDAKKGAK